MANKSTNYWDKRALKRLDDSEKMSEAYIKRIKKIYDKAYKDIDREIANVYKNYSKDTGLDVEKLKELLTRSQTEKLWEQMKRQGLDKYVKDNYKARISRLEQIQAQIYAKAKRVYPKEELEQTMCYKGVINDSYYKAVYDTQMGTGYGFSFSKIDKNTLDTILNERWSGKNYSQRIWGNTDILADSLSEVLGGALISGQSIEKTSKQIRDRFNVSKYYAERLVRTETNHFNNLADAMAYEEMDVDKYVFVATLDNRTSEICISMDNKVFKYSEKEEGVNYPPLHPNCRSKTRGYVEDAEKNIKRRARNPITGKSELVDNISYKDWLKQYDIVGNKDGMFKTSQNVTYNTNTLNKLDTKLVETNTKQLSKLINKYPKVASYIKDIGLNFGGSNRGGAIAYTSWTKDFKRLGIYLEQDYFGNSKDYINAITKGVKNFEFMPCSDKNINNYAITHEFGHVIENYLLKEYSLKNPDIYKKALNSQYQWDKYKNEVYNNIRNEIIDIASKNDFDILKELSSYGQYSPAEFFAECFANMESGKPNKLGKAMKKYLKGVM